ncbi:MAG: RtcB family protein [Bacteroidota bacterium]
MAKIKKVHLLRAGFEPGSAMKEALKAMQHRRWAKKSRDVKMEVLEDLLDHPEKYEEDEILGPIVQALTAEERAHIQKRIPPMRNEGVSCSIYGREHIDEAAVDQINIAAKLPIARATALMPDAHVGYGLPIGGVLATAGAIIPFAVGVDIGCRMALSIFRLGEKHLERHHYQYEQDLKRETAFGTGKGVDDPWDDPVLDRKEFQEVPFLRNLKDKAARQIGSSGGGNHFVEFGIVEIIEMENEWNLAPGKYLGVLSHSGSRGFGAAIATEYTRIAQRHTPLPKEAKNLAWLDLDTEEGQEYWISMNLAGDYASACHDHIHRRLAKAIGEKPICRIENHHNFAWEQKLPDGTEVIVHRKGATPAAKGELGIIPGSMSAPGFIVRGKGNPTSLHSASHGAGRVLSRRKARSSITRHQMNKHLKEKGITLIGGGIDEAPFVYKDIEQVMAHQRELVEVLGKFHPKIVRMDKA